MDIFSDLMLCQGMVVQLIFNRSIFCLLMLHGEIWGNSLKLMCKMPRWRGGLLQDVCFRRVKSWGVGGSAEFFLISIM